MYDNILLIINQTRIKREYLDFLFYQIMFFFFVQVLTQLLRLSFQNVFKELWKGFVM